MRKHKNARRGEKMTQKTSFKAQKRRKNWRYYAAYFVVNYAQGAKTYIT